MKNLSTTNKYTLIGALFGLMFPLIATCVVSIEENVSILEAQVKGGLLIWIIDTAPIFLGLFARLGGLKQEKLESIYEIKKNPKGVLNQNHYDQFSDSKLLKPTVLVPLFTFIGLSVLSILMFSNTYHTEKKLQEKYVKAEAKSILGKMQVALEERILAMDRMANRFINTDLDNYEKWQADSYNYLENFPGLSEIAWINTNEKIKWRQPTNFSLPAKIRYSFKYLSVQDSSANSLSMGQFSDATFKKFGSFYIYSYHPTFLKNKHTGFFIAVYNLKKITELFTSPNFYLNATGFNGFELVNDLKQPNTETNSIRDNIKVRNVKFNFDIIPNNHFLENQYKGNKSFFNLVLLLMISFCISLVIRMFLKNKQSEKNHNIINNEIKNALDEIAIVVKTDVKGKIIEVNKKFIEISKFTKKELIGKDHRIINSGHHAKSYMKNLWNTISNGEIWRGEIKNKAKDGSFYWVDTSIIPRFDQNGIISGYTAIRSDITEKKKREKELIEAKIAADIALKTKSTFLANMSHEIRTPLNGILGCTNLLLDNVENPESIKLLKTVMTCGDTLLTLINDILDFSKLESEKMELENEPFDLKSSVEQIHQLFCSKASEKSVRIVFNYAKDVPEWIIGDVTRINQILSNLVSNAIKFTENGKVEINTFLEEVKDEDYVIHFSVSDEGIGLSQKGIEKLFQKFSQVDASTTKRFGGTGLGLAICKSLVELMGGKIWVESEEEKGSTFHFTIKAKKALKKTIIKSITPSQKYNTNLAADHPLKILLADDNRVNQLVGKKLIEKLGYRIDVAADGLEVIQMLKESKYDLVFMDCHMPQMDGFEATKEIINTFKEKRPRIVALTASALKQDRDKCLASGMDDFISKPIEMSEVVRVLKDCDPSPVETKTIQMPVFNEEALFSQFGEDKDLIAEISKEFIKKTPDYLDEIEKAILENDTKKLEISSHTLKGVSSNFHAKKVVELCFKLEQLGVNNTFDGATEILSELKESINELNKELESFCSKKVA